MKNIHYKSIILFFSAIFVLIPYGLSGKALKSPPKAEKGCLDLTQWDCDSLGIVKLQGEWEFYWKRFYTPEDFRNNDSLPGKMYIKIPGSWTKLSVNNEKLPKLGYATYRLKIKIPAKNEFYMFKINEAYTSYKLYLNGIFRGEMGKVDTTEAHAIPKFVMKEYPIEITGNTTDSYEYVEIILHISNFHHKKSGLSFSPTFGTALSVMNSIKDRFVLNLIIIGIILIIGLNHVIHFLFRRSDRSNLYFGILCIVMILRNITTDDHILTYWFPQLSWQWLIKLDNFSGFGTIAFFALFLYSAFRQDFPKIMLYILVVLGIIISTIIFATPILFFNKLSLFFELYVLFGGLYMTFGVLLPALIKGRQGAFLTFLGYLVLTGTAINDVLSNMAVINTIYVAPYGLVFFMVTESYLITSNSAKALQQNEKLSEELRYEKQNLEDRIHERMQELEKQNLELTKLRSEELLNNWFNQTYADLNEILNREKSDIGNLTSKILSSLIKHVKANVGAIYLLEDSEEGQEPYLKLVATYGVDKETSKISRIEINEGLVGSCFATGTMKYLDEVPSGYLKVSSGLGATKPRALLIVPLKLNEKTYGIIEMASLKRFTDKQIELISRISENLTFTINSLTVNIRTERLLSQYQEKELELRNKENEMRQNLEELEFLREEIKRLKGNP